MSADCKIVGQGTLVNKIDDLSIDSFPHSLLLIGERGCGKHLLCSYISMHLNIPLVELDNNIKEEDVEDIVIKPYPCLYIVNLDNALPKLQNNLLKIAEEPSAGTFIIGLSTSTNLILPTLLNRCQKWYFEEYTEKELSRFISSTHADIKDILLDTFRTPGQVIEAQDHPIAGMKALSEDILNRVWTSSIPNILNIPNKLAFKGEKDKFNVDIFVKVLNKSIKDRIATDSDVKWVKMFEEASHLEERLKFSLSKVRVIEEFLVGCRLIAVGES